MSNACMCGYWVLHGGYDVVMWVWLRLRGGTHAAAAPAVLSSFCLSVCLFVMSVKSKNDSALVELAAARRPVDAAVQASSETQWRNYERRSEATASGRQAAGCGRGRFWSTDCLLCTTEFSWISKERKKLKNKQNDRNLVYLYIHLDFRTKKVHL